MKQELESYLWDRLSTIDDEGNKNFPRDIINEMLQKGLIKNPKQARRTLEKWERKGLYDYGVTLDLGWINKE